jgi:hypothetical protein
MDAGFTHDICRQSCMHQFLGPHAGQRTCIPLLARNLVWTHAKLMWREQAHKHEMVWQQQAAVERVTAEHKRMVDDLTMRNASLERECEEERKRHVMMQANAKREVCSTPCV